MSLCKRMWHRLVALDPGSRSRCIPPGSLLMFSEKVCTGHVSSDTAQCERLKRRMRGKEDGTTRSNIFPRHRLSSFLLATRVKENFKFWLRWQSDRSWSQGKGNPPSHSSGFSFNFVDSGCGVLWRVLFFRGLPRDGAPWRSILHRSWPSFPVARHLSS